MSLETLLQEVRACTLCAESLPLGPRPLLKLDRRCRLVIIGQAPGRRAHESGIPWDDPSGKRLREWLGVTDETFYDDPRLGLLPMGFCYPGTGKSGDLPPRPECATTWHERLLAQLPEIATIVVIGRYAQQRYLPASKGKSLTEAVRSWQETFPERLLLPHPSPRNNRWLKRNPWFTEEVLPALQCRTRALGFGS